jgi:hypothetical protein
MVLLESFEGRQPFDDSFERISTGARRGDWWMIRCVTKRPNLGLVIAFLAIAGGVLYFFSRNDPEPVYQGKTLSAWLKGYNPLAYGPASTPQQWKDHVSAYQTNVSAANDAMHHIGTNAIPFLCRMLREQDPPLKTKLVGLIRRHHFFETSFTLATERNHQAGSAIEALGDLAANAVPELIEMYKQKRYQRSVLLCLDASAPASRAAMPILMAATTNADSAVRLYSALALEHAQAEPYLVVSILAKSLHDPDPVIREQAVFALYGYGFKAKSAVPDLITSLSDTNTLVRSTARILLTTLDAEALSNNVPH